MIFGQRCATRWGSVQIKYILFSQMSVISCNISILYSKVEAFKHLNPNFNNLMTFLKVNIIILKNVILPRNENHPDQAPAVISVPMAN